MERNVLEDLVLMIKRCVDATVSKGGDELFTVPSTKEAADLQDKLIDDIILAKLRLKLGA